MNSPIYVLGAGSIGSLLACELASLPSLQNKVVLLLRNQARAEQFRAQQSLLTIERTFEENAPQIQCKLKATYPAELNVDTIDNLIVTTKTVHSERAILDYVPYIKKDSNILFVQNGLGVIEHLKRVVWTDESKSPNLYQGITTHGCFQKKDFHYVHAGLGNLKIAKVGSSAMDSTCALVELLMKSKTLNTSYLSYDDLLISQCEKLVINACMNPNTAILDCMNRELSNIEEVKVLFKCIITECVDVFFKSMPNLAENPKARQTLDIHRLLDFVMYVGFVVCGNNSSSMRQDTLFKRDTEIDSINGWIVKLANELGYPANVNKTITLLAKIRAQVNQRRI
ncbi:2-dehydropantoate 2-reductase [Schizosaccharomyces cryophilus OY26]|uniref:2-dehydropantoate 2-reductase n=1 Tax=Schizosaccharomyces cryophilus (strain OY26 / ATCC MYA-4695 / CBS 11777 / NBRC 106824 / NRRL Y48691) TaxID=653667 RepID=S9X0F8_SCHCR|nr:2-dehydropantoate 2-reductase [Schizosaccharomyces cryophilus OY26]EPY50437.1 2-dehydropantoate 2-reductase [Schizosaccharomyces cryophilus OY26]